MKTLKKYVALLALASLVAGPASALAETCVTTELTKDGGSGVAPQVLVKWEMYPDTHGINGRDDSTTALTQFNSTGVYGDNVEFKVCSIVRDADGLADLATVGAKVFYPTGVWGASVHPDAGCGWAVGNQFVLNQLGCQDGINLICGELRTNNANLPMFNEAEFAGLSLTEKYAKLCAEDYDLKKCTARVYCGDKTISYEDPSGDYKVMAFAQDKSGLNGLLENTMKYVDTAAYEVDFTGINFGNVKLQTKKIINGDLSWNNPAGPNNASVRNTGNVRIKMQVMESDMGFGKFDSGEWKVKFDGRIGNDATSIDFNPETWTTLNGELDLSEMDEMDFSIYVKEFPYDHTENTYQGAMSLKPVKIAHNTCAQ
jgi:hypothetical protein